MNYTITFFNNGYGQEVAALTNVNIIPELPILEETGFIFEGWYLDEELTTPAEAGMEVNSNITLYASWSRNRRPTTPATEDESESSTYANIINPGESITPSNPGGGGSTTEVTYYKGNSFFSNYFPGTPITDYVYDNYENYYDWSTLNLSNYFSPGNSSVILPVKAASDDPWVETVDLPWYYSSSKTQVKVVKPGTRPTFAQNIFSTADWANSYGTYVNLNIYRKTDCLYFEVKTLSGTVLKTGSFYPKNNMNDGSLPTKVIIALQAPGGGGYKRSSSTWCGGGGAGGDCLFGVFNLDNVVSQHSSAKDSTPCLIIQVPTATKANTNGSNIVVRYPTGYGSSGFTFTDIVKVIGGKCGQTKLGGVGNYYDSDDTTFGTGPSSLYPVRWNQYDCRPNPSGTYYTELGGCWDPDSEYMPQGTIPTAKYWWSLPVRWSYASTAYGFAEAVGGADGGTGYTNMTSTAGGDVGVCFVYSSYVKNGSSGWDGSGWTSDLTEHTNLYREIHSEDGGSGPHGGGGGASLFGDGGGGASTASGNASAGISGGGGGGSGNGNAGQGGGGLVYIWY